AFLYVTSYDGSLSIIDTAHNTSTTVPNASSIAEVVSPDGQRFYSLHHGMTPVPGGWISVIDSTGTRVVTVPLANDPAGMDLNPDGSRLYVATSERSSYKQYPEATISVIDTGTYTVIDTTPVPSSPSTITVSPDGSRVFVTHYDIDVISVIDLKPQTVMSVTVQDAPLSAAFTPDGRQVYVTGLQSLAVIDDLTNGTEPIAVGDLPRRLRFSDD